MLWLRVQALLRQAILGIARQLGKQSRRFVRHSCRCFSTPLARSYHPDWWRDSYHADGLQTPKKCGCNLDANGGGTFCRRQFCYCTNGGSTPAPSVRHSCLLLSIYSHRSLQVVQVVCFALLDLVRSGSGALEQIEMRA